MIFFIFVVCNCLLSFFIRKKINAIHIALILTCVADYFLVLTEQIVAGLICFIGVQFCYRTMLKKIEKKDWLIFLPLFITNFPIIVRLGVIYAFLLFHNFILCYRQRNKTKQFLLLSIGFLLFMLCDVFVFLHFLQVEGSYPLIWIFYIPSQLCINFSQIGKK